MCPKVSLTALVNYENPPNLASGDKVTATADRTAVVFFCKENDIAARTEEHTVMAY